jgi:hypothetical protein
MTRVASLLAGAVLVLGPASAPTAPAPLEAAQFQTHALDGLKLNQTRAEGSHNSYRKFPSPAEEQRIKTVAARFWPGLDYGHPPLESQLALGLHQFEIDVAADPKGGLYAAPYADATPEIKALMAAPGAKTMHVPGLDTESHCLTFRKCLAIFAHWSDTHPGHDPIVILVNSVDWPARPGLWPTDAIFTQADIDAVNQDIAEVIGKARVITPDEVRGARATLREGVMAGGWPTVSAARGRFLFVLDGNGAHERFLRTGHASLRGRMMFGWFDEDQPEAAVFNIQQPQKEMDRIKRLVAQGFIVRTRADADVVEARTRDGRRMKAALASGAQWVSTDFYAGVPDPEGFGYVADFEGPMYRCNEVTADCAAKP